MALIPNFTTCVNTGCAGISFRELTGVYDATSNPGGYGAPNVELGAITETHLIITLPDGITEIDILNPTGLPTSDTADIYTILPEVLDASWTTIEDGLYTIEYTVSDGDETYTTGPVYFLFTCSVDCCVSKLFLKIAQSGTCVCDDYKIKNALYSWALLKGVKANAGCGDASTISDLIEQLNRACNPSGCGCSR